MDHTMDGALSAFDEQLTELHLDYLMLCRSIAREDPARAAFRLGVTTRAVERLANMSREELRKIASNENMGLSVRGAALAQLEGEGTTCQRARAIQRDLGTLAHSSSRPASIA